MCVRPYPYKEYSSLIRKKEILPIVTPWIGPEGVMLNETSQTEKDRHCMLLRCGLTKSQTHRHGE